jgi:hypothetical protein
VSEDEFIPWIRGKMIPHQWDPVTLVTRHIEQPKSTLAAQETAPQRCSAARINVFVIVMSTITVVRLVSSLPSLFDTMTSHRDIYIYEMLRNDYAVPTRCRHRGGMIDPLGCKACRAIR